MNSPFPFILGIILIVMGANVVMTYIKHKYKKPEVDPELEISEAKIDQLEERIRVLERIITEERYDLKREIDSL